LIILHNEEWINMKCELMEKHEIFSKIKNTFLVSYTFLLAVLYFLDIGMIRELTFNPSNGLDIIRVVTTYAPFAFVLMFFIFCLSICWKNLTFIKLFYLKKEFSCLFLFNIIVLLFTALFLKIYILMDFRIMFIFGIIYFLNFVYAFVIHLYAFIPILKVYHEHHIIREREGILNFRLLFLSIISPDYVMATLFKKLLNNKSLNLNCEDNCAKDEDLVNECTWEQRKLRAKYFIVFSNWTNVIFITGLSILAMYIYPYLGAFTKYLGIWLILHILSRSFEIAYAFYKDVVEVKAKVLWKSNQGHFINYWRTSALRKPERITLAIHSYIEVILFFTLLYLFLLNEYNIDIVNLNKYRDIFLYSSSVTFFNYSFDPKINNEIWKLFHALQVFLSIVLVVLSIATYIGMKDEMDSKEKMSFVITKYYLNKRNCIKKLETKKKLSDEDNKELKRKIEFYDKTIKGLKAEYQDKYLN